MRYTTRAKIVATITTAIADPTVIVDHAWPGEVEGKDTIWLGPSVGTASVPVFRGPASVSVPIIVDDVFTVPVHIYAGSVGTSYALAEARADALYDLARKALAADPGLGSLSDSVANPHAFVIEAVMSGLDGPHTGENPSGPASWFTFEIAVHTREQ